MTKTGPIRVILVDDNEMVRRGLALFIQAFDDLVLVGEGANGAEALHLCAQLKPDVALMDLVMPEMDGVAATDAIRLKYPETQVIALTSFRDKSVRKAVQNAGAINYLPKNISINRLASAIRAAKNGVAA